VADIYHQFGSDLVAGPTGDLASAAGTTLGQQRVLRRLLTNPGDYIWQLTYGAGLAQFVGQPVDVARIGGVIRSQMLREPAVARSPEPVVDVLDQRNDAGAEFPAWRNMMLLPLQNFTTLVGNAVAAVQGSARQLLDLSVGSTLRAVLEANASLALWLQWLIVQVLQMTRASTSSGPDLDSWMGDFSLTRLPAVAATGQVTLARFVATSPAAVQPGITVRTSDGSQSFAVLADPTNPAWQAASSNYGLAAGVASINVKVQAVVAGVAGNVQAAAISLIAAAVPGVDTVTNAAPLGGGVDAESDAALRTRFQLFLQTLSRATPLAVGAAVLSTRQGLSWTLLENVASDGSARPGSFLVTIDDGTGYPPASVLQAAATAIEATRPVGTTFGVQAPGIIPVTVELAVAVAAVASHATVAANVAGAVTAYVDGLTVGAALSCSRLVQVAYNGDANVTNVTGLTVNGGTADIAVGVTSVIKLASVQVN
jgi:uncharacterized phage protein gp47/JayE